jgi:hypothetical protein
MTFVHMLKLISYVDKQWKKMDLGHYLFNKILLQKIRSFYPTWTLLCGFAMWYINLALKEWFGVQQNTLDKCTSWETNMGSFSSLW